MNRNRNTDFYNRAAVIPGRSSTRSKAPGKFFDVGDGPMYAAYGTGAQLVDVDGRPYIDMLCALGAISLGYGRERTNYPRPSGVYSLPHASEVLAAEKVLACVAPWASQVRFVRTGSEALSAAVLMARQETGRRPVLVAKGSYHGWHGWASQRGVKGTEGEWTFEFDYGCDLDAWEPERLTDSPPAAIVVEPSRWQDTPSGWLYRLQKLAWKMGALFIVDEMIYGGRWALGGATFINRLVPDLACFGKALGNGAPVAMVVGNDVLRERGEWISGTYSGDAGAAEAVVETLDVYAREPVIATMWARGTHLRELLEDAVVETGWSGFAFVEGAAPVHQRLRFKDAALGKVFSAKMSGRGVLWHPEVANICYAHTREHIQQVADAAHAALQEMTEERR